MESVLHALGLGTAASGAPVPCYAAGAIIYSFVFAHTVLSSRGPKIKHRLDHNVSPRGDLDKYGTAAVAAGKLSQARLDQLRRLEGAHANSIEHLPFFIGSVLFTLHAGLPSVFINRICAAYVLSRAGYAAAYYYINRHALSYLRSAFWWASNFTCMYALYAGGKAINA